MSPRLSSKLIVAKLGLWEGQTASIRSTMNIRPSSRSLVSSHTSLMMWRWPSEPTKTTATVRLSAYLSALKISIFHRWARCQVKNPCRAWPGWTWTMENRRMKPSFSTRSRKLRKKRMRSLQSLPLKITLLLVSILSKLRSISLSIHRLLNCMMKMPRSTRRDPLKTLVSQISRKWERRRQSLRPSSRR